MWRKALFITFLSAFALAQSTDLFISEYIEGSGNNKALEIYNGTGSTVDMSEYGIITNSNGSGWYDPGRLSGSLPDGETYVIINPGFDFSLIDSAAVVDTLWGAYATYFNGDDARGLVHFNADSTWTIIDLVGDTTGGDPGYGWAVAGVDNATADHTLLRKAGVSGPNADWSSSAGTDASNSEWIVMDQNYVDNLGAYPATFYTSVTFTVTDSTFSYTNIKIKGSMTDWAAVQAYDDGTNGDAVAGDAVWTAVVDSIQDGDYDWGAIEDDGSEWGIWLIDGPNLEFTVAGGVVSGDTDYVIPAPSGVTATVTLQADISGMTTFDPSIHTLEIRGSLNGWAGGDEMAPDLFDPNLYSIDMELTLEVGTVVEWKFKANPDSLWNNNGWEAGDNHTFTWTGENIVLDPLAPNILPAGQPLQNEVTISYAIEFRDGTLNDVNGLPFPVAPDTIVVNGSFMNGWYTWGDCMGPDCGTPASPDMPRLTDDDGDGIYTGTLTLPAGHDNLFMSKFGAYYPGIDSLATMAGNGAMDNEAGFGADRVVIIPIDATTFDITDIFGSNNPENPWLGIDEVGNVIPDKFALRGNYPNPFNPSTNIRFDLDVKADVTVTIYSLIGTEVITLKQGLTEPGRYEILWQARDQFGHRVPSGIYFYQVKADERTLSGKMVLMK